MAFTAADRDRFLQNPPAFLNSVAISFVSDSILTATIKNQPDALTLRDQGAKATKVSGFGDKEVPAYVLTKAKPGEVSFPSYIADYVKGATTPTVLGQAANLCFTTNMNGCTFGIGSQGRAGDALLVTHGNASGQAGLAELGSGRGKGGTQGGITAIQTSLQYSDARAVLGDGAKVFEPEHYREGGKQSITFGWRQAGQKWKFFFLSYEKTGATVRTFGVSPVQTNYLEDRSRRFS